MGGHFGGKFDNDYQFQGEFDNEYQFGE